MRTNRTVWLFSICTIMVIGLWPATGQAVERGPVGAWIGLNAYDANDDLIIQEEELGAAFAGFRENIADVRKRLLEAFDADADGLISQEEYEARDRKVDEAAMRYQKLQPIQGIDTTKLFEQLEMLQLEQRELQNLIKHHAGTDTDYDGTITEEELKAAEAYIRKIADDRNKMILEALDTNKDGKIDAAEKTPTLD